MVLEGLKPKGLTEDSWKLVVLVAGVGTILEYFDFYCERTTGRHDRPAPLRGAGGADAHVPEACHPGAALMLAAGPRGPGWS